MPIAQTIFCRDRDVRAFVEAELANISPYSQPELVMTALELFEAARQRFGDHRLLDLEFWPH